MGLRFGYTLMRVRPEDTWTDYETVADEVFSVESDDELRQRSRALEDWAVRQLTGLQPHLALFYALFSSIDEDDVPGLPLGSVHLAWEGRSAVPLAG